MNFLNGSRTIALAAAVLGLASASANAAFVLVDDFENYEVNTALSGQGGWVASDAAVSVRQDPADATNQTMGVSHATKYARKPLGANSIANGTTGTLFYQFQITGTTLSIGHGLADDPTPSFGANNSYEVHISSGNNGATKPYDASTTAEDFDPALTLSTNTWYSLWLVADNSADTFRVYIQGGSFTNQTELVGPDTLNFKFGTSDPLQTFLIVANSSNGSSITHFDNLYIDNTGANLANPIPEPATATTVLTLAGLVAMRRRRR